MSVTPHDVERVRRAIALATKGRFAVEPNPVVGCVLERDGRIVGESWHADYGGPHAEARAIETAGEAARCATAYVSLEPCTGTAKKTPPCAEALHAAGVRRVVYAAADPSPEMSGRGAARLGDLGLEIEGPVLEAEGAAILAAFRRAVRARRPWVVCKWAMSWDGRIAPGPGRGAMLSGPRAARFVHDLRGRCEAVAVGVGTVLADDPLLTCRLEGGPPDARPQPLRIVFDSRLRLPVESRLLRDGGGPVLVVTARGDRARREAVEATGAEVWEHAGDDGRVDLAAALERLRAERGVRRLLVEGGARLNGSLLRDGLVDQVSAIVAPRILGGSGAPGAAEGTGFRDLESAPRLTDVAWRPLGEDFLLQGYVSG
jgi:diaminohydroxyphosphoribosylaminopyrimidine deaminase/5-amino-6-(5-phosphoribosylamino)uracil reductase